MTVHGVLLAAGAGTRMGRPKALVRAPDGEAWLVRGVRALHEGGCDAVTVVLGARAAEAAPLLVGAPPSAVVVAENWAEGMGASLRAGLAALADTGADVAVVSLVDLPDVTGEVVRRLLATPVDRTSLSRASYDGEPGHPVLLGRDHWAGVLTTATGDRGARDYLAAHPVVLVECGDLATGRDQDAPG